MFISGVLGRSIDQLWPWSPILPLAIWSLGPLESGRTAAPGFTMLLRGVGPKGASRDNIREP